MVGTGEALGVLEKASDLDRKFGYFRNNAHRMRYARFRKLGMFTGSGAIEGGIKAIVVQRAKQSGMHWTVEGAADVIALRCQYASGRWNELWPASTPTPSRAACSHLTDSKTQTQRPQAQARSFPTNYRAPHPARRVSVLNRGATDPTLAPGPP